MIIGLALTTLLLTFLFSSYRHLVIAKVEVEKLQSALHPKFFTQARLAQIFDNLEPGCPFYTTKGLLHFTFDNGIEPDPEFCGPLDGTIGLAKATKGEKRAQLVLSIRDRKEILHKNVKTLEFAFFNPLKKEWTSDWRGSGSSPSIVRITVDQEEYHFRIPGVGIEVVFS